MTSPEKDGWGNCSCKVGVRCWHRDGVPPCADAQPANTAQALLSEVMNTVNVDLPPELWKRISAYLSAPSPDYKEKYLNLCVQHARLCDQVYEEDGETLRYAAASAKAGYVSVPVKPTSLMVEAMCEVDTEGEDNVLEAMRQIYAAALAAAASEQRGGSDE